MGVLNQNYYEKNAPNGTLRDINNNIRSKFNYRFIIVELLGIPRENRNKSRSVSNCVLSKIHSSCYAATIDSTSNGTDAFMLVNHSGEGASSNESQINWRRERERETKAVTEWQTKRITSSCRQHLHAGIVFFSFRTNFQCKLWNYTYSETSLRYDLSANALRSASQS